MKNFDWSKVTEKQLRNVPQAVVGDDLEVDADDRPFYLEYRGVLVAELWPLNTGWLFTVCAGERYERKENTIRVALACIDRIANYLTIHGGNS